MKHAAFLAAVRVVNAAVRAKLLFLFNGIKPKVRVRALNMTRRLGEVSQSAAVTRSGRPA